MEVDNTSFDKFLQPSGERLDDDSHGDADDIESITTIPRVSFAPDVANTICFDEEPEEDDRDYFEKLLDDTIASVLGPNYRDNKIIR